MKSYKNDTSLALVLNWRNERTASVLEALKTVLPQPTEQELVMDHTSVSDRARTINLSIKQSTLDHLVETTAQASALAEVALCADFWSFRHRIQYDYLWLLSDLISDIKEMCEQLEPRPPKKENF